jgi:hypothetical protein
MNSFRVRQMPKITRLTSAVGVLALGLISQTAAWSQTFVSGSTGADGPMPICTPAPCTTTLQLPSSGIFNFTTVTIPDGVTVKFLRNQANTPVVILTTGDVTSSGVIDVSGTAAVSGVPGRGGPGGFDGGLGGTGFGSSPNGTPGIGPGGGQGGVAGVGTAPGSASGGGFGTQGTGNGAAVTGGQTYGVHTLFPLIGGSGGGGGAGGPTSSGPAGGGGGGAIMIASSGTITMNAPQVFRGIFASGGNGAVKAVGLSANVASGCGSGGGIRLIANSIVTGGAALNVGSSCTSGIIPGGFGRVRLETFQLSGNFNLGGNPSTSQALPQKVLPDNASPSVHIVSIGGASVPPTPQATFFNVPDVTVNPNLANPITVALQANNVPLGTAIGVSVVTEGVATRSTFTSTALAGTLASSSATVNVTLPAGTSVLTATATFVAP